MKLYVARGIINGEGEILEGNSILIKDGFIERVGNKSELITNHPDVEIHQYHGYIYPGFIDCHIHFTGTAVDMLSVDCRKTENFADLFKAIKNQITCLPKETLVICSYFDPDNYEEKCYPTLEILTKLFPENPIFITHIECHGAIINNRFKELYHGALNDDKGLIVGEDNSNARRFIFDNLDENYKLQGLFLAQQEALKQGVTAIHAMEGGQLFSSKDVDLIIKNRDKFKIDITIYHQTLDVDTVKANSLKQIGGCILIDGSSGVYTAALTKPYRLHPEKKGLLYFEKGEIVDFIRKAQANCMQVALHCCGDRALDFLMDCFEEVNHHEKIKKFRHRIEHFEIPRPDQIVRCKSLGLTLSMQPSFDYFWGGPKGDYFHTLGDRWKWTNPLSAVVAAGIVVGGGSDSGVTPISPLLGIHSCVNHHNISHRISVETALKMYTKNAAYLTFEENNRGDIEKGFLANLTVLKDNLLKVDKEKIKDIEVLATIIKGEIAISTKNDKKG